MGFVDAIKKCVREGTLPKNVGAVLEEFYYSYEGALKNQGRNVEESLPSLLLFLELVIKNLQHPPVFELFHQKITTPIDYYRFGLDLLRPLVIFESSKVLQRERIDTMEQQLAQQENVVLFANHQTEPDPQAISLLLEKSHPAFAENIIFVAGNRVISDPLAIPFSLGRNLICIYSKKHMENPPEEKEEKSVHNQRSLKRLGQILAEGGKCIFVAPSGGRDRPDETGDVIVSPFDPQSIEIFRLIAQQAKTTTHFYPLALKTYPPLAA